MNPENPHPEKMANYEAAYRVAKNLEGITSYEERLAFWDLHRETFGDASVLVFDEEEQKYFSWVGHAYGSIDLEPQKRYKAFWIWPNDVKEFGRFMIWCTEKYKFWNHFAITDQAYYWQQIKRELFPEDYLNTLLDAAEKLRNQIQTLPNPFTLPEIEGQSAKDYFFFYGNQDATKGDMGGASTDSDLFTVFSKISTRSLSEYGMIFCRYWHGYHTAMMVQFLREQRKRLDRKEIISLPANSNFTPPPLTEEPAAKQTGNEKTANKPRNKKQKTLEDERINLTYFRQQVRDRINDAVNKKQEPDEVKILKTAMESTAKAKNKSMEKLRKDIPPALREEHYGKISREISETKTLYIK